MLRFFMLFLIYTTSSLSQDCSIETEQNIFFIKSKEPLNFIRKSHCASEIKREFNNFIQSSNGLMRSSDVERILSEKFHSSIKISPLRINVHDIEKSIKTHMSLPKDRKFQELKILGKKRLLLSGKNIEMKINCHNCHSLGEKQIKLEFIDKTKNSILTAWIKGKILEKTWAVISKKTLPFNNRPLSEKDFLIKHIYTSKPENFFSQTNKIRFYKANKNIQKDSLLRRSDVTPVKLVTPNMLTDVTYLKNNLFLRTKARPTRAGYHGDIIQLKRHKNNSIIVGKVIDHGKVIIEI